MAGPSAEQLRMELSEIGARRGAQEKDAKKLAKDTARAVKRARGVLSMVEVARLVGLDRTSLYQTYRA